MQIVIFKKGKYITYNFPKSMLDEIRKICYDMSIKYYCINYQGDVWVIF